MSMHEAAVLVEKYSLAEANAAIQEDWKLLAVVPGDDAVIYILGKPAPEPEMAKNINIRFT
ncbi:hypothetical protein [Pseudomonas extremaustralis]|uniref:Uncharacterized protein n=1 Tax=Pseudomonas extremaustralis TaxID=359110 RepID=A0A5C5PZA1_9PSED|nr:hypothetical protein [Pseudomonas extremaustralis]EZI23187.1 hypothetical protein PE143B_0130680 [Pseudomonas extremaustralis 14-3 substr. 14-3b]MDF3135963.1 hypothetical protein [Pseudomonas extremaustralis]TWR96444.1 hypothetical protein FIV36_30815 [Pseudomonas extremaustralis]SDG38391.1 hypothetical protein SAMN05216591_5885 [Pseudomonas extremaustralis]